MFEQGVRLLSVWHIEQWLIQQLARDIVFLHLQDVVDPLHALGSFLGEGDNTGWQPVETSTAAQVANLSASIHSG